MFSLRPVVVSSPAPVSAPLPPLEPLEVVATPSEAVPPVVSPSETVVVVAEAVSKPRKKKAVAGVDKPANSGEKKKKAPKTAKSGEKKPRKPSIRRTPIGLFANYERKALKALKLKLDNKKIRLSEDAIVGLMYIHNAFIRATAAHAVRINSYRDKKTVNGFDVYEAKRLALAKQVAF